VLRAVLTRNWTSDQLALVPPSFITGALLPALLQPQHHRDAQQQPSAGQLASAFLVGYLAGAGAEACREVLGGWLQGLCVAELPALGLQASLLCLRDAAGACGQGGGGQGGGGGGEAAAWRDAALRRLAAAAAQMVGHVGADYRLQNYQLILQVGRRPGPADPLARRRRPLMVAECLVKTRAAAGASRGARCPHCL
jgi:hypothetical protein